MERIHAYAMSLAGLDPSGGAGLLADIKTFEAHGIYGLGVCTALTVQTDHHFSSVEWQTPGQIIAQAKPLLERFPVSCCKIGIMENTDALLEVVLALHTLQLGLRIVLDPVLSASAGYDFHADVLPARWQQVLAHIYLLTPNYGEAMLLSGSRGGAEAARILRQYCAVLLKGGHHPGREGFDMLYMQENKLIIPPGTAAVFPKHGSGCVLSAAITARLAMGYTLPDACIKAKLYTEKFLCSHSSLLGYHYA